MTRAIQIISATALLMLIFIAMPAFAEEPHMKKESSTKQAIVLTDQQKQELAMIYQEMFNKKRQLIEKYAEFGVVSKEQATKWTARLNEHYLKLEQNGFVPEWGKCKQKREKRAS